MFIFLERIVEKDREEKKSETANTSCRVQLDKAWLKVLLGTRDHLFNCEARYNDSKRSAWKFAEVIGG